MKLSGLLEDYPEIEEEIEQLNQGDSARFQRLLAKRYQKLSLPLVIVAGLGLYCFIVGLWLHPSYSWILALLPTLFLTVFGRSQIAGVISAKDQASKYYGLISLPLVFAALCTFCGALTNSYFNISFDDSDYSVESLQQQKADCNSGVEDKEYRCEDIDSELREAERQEDREKEENSELLRGIIMSGVAIIAIYPVSVYYLRSVIRKNNLLTIKQILEQLKEGERKPPPPPKPPDPGTVE